jgi:hypothetical protein
MMKRRICLLALPLLSTAACLDMRDQDSTDGTSSQALAPRVLTDHICEQFGAQWCVGAPTLAFEDPVVETVSGRIMQFIFVSGGVNLAFNADPTKCVAVKNNSNLVEIRACSQPSAVWIVQTGPNGHSCVFQNQLGGVLGGRGDGGQYSVVPTTDKPAFKQFTVPSLGCI